MFFLNFFLIKRNVWCPGSSITGVNLRWCQATASGILVCLDLNVQGSCHSFQSLLLLFPGSISPLRKWLDSHTDGQQLLQKVALISILPFPKCRKWKISTNTITWKVKVTLSCLTLWPHGIYSSWNPPGQNTGLGSLSFLLGIFPTQGSNPGLLPSQTDSLPAELLRKLLLDAIHNTRRHCEKVELLPLKVLRSYMLWFQITKLLLPPRHLGDYYDTITTHSQMLPALKS